MCFAIIFQYNVAINKYTDKKRVLHTFLAELIFKYILPN